MNRLVLITIVSNFIFLMACSGPKIVSQSNMVYEESIKAWQVERIDALTSPTGWLSLIGLFWLKEGTTSFGSALTNKIKFPSSTPANIGSFTLENGEVIMQINPKVLVKIGDQTPKKITLKADIVDSTTYASLGTVNWHLIQRANRFGIRVRDSHNDAIQSFKGIPNFPIQEKWNIPATLRPSDTQKEVTLRNVVDMDVQMKLEGYLVFEIAGQKYELEAMDGGETSYFVIFSDATTGESTYGAGRYLYVPRVDKSGKTMIDFNKAHNPPCAFTDFATCPLPSAKNQLAIAIPVGEKDYH